MGIRLLQRFVLTIILSLVVPSGMYLWILTDLSQECFASRHAFECSSRWGLYRGVGWSYLVWLAGEDWMTPARISEAWWPHDPLTGLPRSPQSAACLQNPARCSRGLWRGDFGISWQVARGYPALDVLQQRWLPTFMLFGAVTIVAGSAALALGLVIAPRPGAKAPAALQAVVSAFISLPIFWLGLLLLMLLGSRLAFLTQWFSWPFLPISDLTSAKIANDSLLAALHAQPGDWLDYAIHALLPFTILTLFFTAQLSPIATSILHTALRQTYIQTARAKGVSETAILYRHALRNALRPFFAAVVQQLPNWLGQIILVETVFNWQGAGFLYVYALKVHDLPVLLAVLFFGVLGSGLLSLLGEALASPTTPAPAPMA